MVKEMQAGSRYTGKLPRGCVLCERGAKLVLLVSGRCDSGCFYCPLSLQKRGRDVIFANELKTREDEEIIMEAELIEAQGTGVTGGDPLSSLERTIHFIRLLKERLGKRHHIHLYTSSLDLEAFSRLEDAGLDELRIHPPVWMWDRMDETGLETFVHETAMKIGLEVPALPDEGKRLEALIKYADKIGLDFVNLNELEFSEGNWKKLRERGYDLKDDISSAVKGSEKLALLLLSLEVSIPIHYCSSSFKDRVQLRKRIMRRARNIARPHDVITEDGTLLKGVVEGNSQEIMETLREKFDVPDELMVFDKEKKRVEVASWVLEEIADQLPFDSYLVEEYPTADRLEVEREPLRQR